MGLCGASAQALADPDAAIITADLDIGAPASGPPHLPAARGAAEIERPAPLERMEGMFPPPRTARQPKPGLEIIGLRPRPATVDPAAPPEARIGGLLGANPQLERRNRRKVGFALRF